MKTKATLVKLVGTSSAAAAVVLIAVTLAGLLQRLWWGFALLHHPRPQYAAGLVLVGLLLFIVKRRWLALLCLTACLLNVAVIYFASPPREASSPRFNLQIAHLNLDRDNRNVAEVVGYIRSGRFPPDIVCLQEYTPVWDAELRRRLTGYRWAEAVPRSDSRGVAMLVRDASTLRVDEVRVLQWLPGEQDRPTLAVRFARPGKPFTVLSLHTKRPQDVGTTTIQRRELDAAARWAAAEVGGIGGTKAPSGRSLVVIGDFNTTPWSAAYGDFLTASRLHHVSGGAIKGSTFPAWLPRFMSLPIDLCAATPDVLRFGASPGPDIGSDHRPLWVMLDMP